MGQHGSTWVNIGQYSVLDGGHQCPMVEVSRCLATRATRATRARKMLGNTNTSARFHIPRALCCANFQRRTEYAKRNEKQIRVRICLKNKFKKTIFFYIPFFSLVLHSVFPWSFKRLAFGIASSKDRHALLLLSESLCLKACV